MCSSFHTLRHSQALAEGVSPGYCRVNAAVTSDGPASAARKLRLRETVKRVAGGRGQNDLVARTGGHRFVRQRHPIRGIERPIGLKVTPGGRGGPREDQRVCRGKAEVQLRRGRNGQRHRDIVQKDGARGVKSVKRKNLTGIRGSDGRGELLIRYGI